MLSKLNRLSTKEIDLLFKKGASFRTPLATIRRRVNNISLAKFAVMFAKGNKLNSVERNRLKRQVYAQIEKDLPSYQTGADYGILLTGRLIAMDDKKREDELAHVLKHLMKPNKTNE